LPSNKLAAEIFNKLLPVHKTGL